MATYRVKDPSGTTFSVTAPDSAKPEEIMARVQAQAQASPPQARSLPKPPPATKKARTVLQTAGDLVGDMVDNILPNWGDEAAGVANVIAGHPLPKTRDNVKGHDALYYLTGGGIADDYAAGKKAFQEHQAQYDREHPKLAWGSTIGGTVAGLALPGGAAMKGAKLGAKAIQAAKVGAAYGALSGAGQGDGLIDRTGNAATSAAVGAAAGPVLATVAHNVPAALRLANRLPGVAAVTRAIGNVPRSVMGLAKRTAEDDAEAATARFAAKRMSQGTIDHGMGTAGPQATPEAIANEVQRRAAMKVPAMVGDTTDSMRALTGWAARGEGPGQSMVREALNKRQRDAATRTRQHVIDTMGEVGDPIKQVEDLVAKSKTDAAPLYKEAYAQPMVITPEIEGIMKTPAFREALPHAVRNIRNAQRDPSELGFRLHPDGSIEGTQTLTTEGFDQVIRAMRDNGRAAMDHSGFRPMDTTNSVHINNRARDLRGHLADQNDAYRDVTARYADDMAQRDARLAGADVANLTGHEINANARHMPDNAKEAWSVGSRTALADEAGQWGAKHPTGNVADRVRQAAGIGDEVKQEAIGRMTGNHGGVRQLGDRLEAENQAHRTWQEVYGNSRTAGRQAADSDLADMAAAMPKGLSTRHMLGGAIDYLVSHAVQKHRSAIKERIARIVTSKDPQDVHELMAVILHEAERDANFQQLLDRSGILATKEYAREIVPQN